MMNEREENVNSLYHQPWLLVQNQIRAEGGREMQRFRGEPEPRDTQNGAEAWIGSVTSANGATAEHPFLGQSQVCLPDGSLRYLSQAIAQAPEEILGPRHVRVFGRELGILLKMLDAKAPFLLQCHPSRQVAKTLWNSRYGKEECWHVLSVRQDMPEKPYILLGFRPGITRQAFEKAYRDENMPALEAMCHKIEVKPGETWFVPAGMPHALGAGCFVIEVQEPSDLTAVPVPQQTLIDFRRRANPRGVFSPMEEKLYERRTLESFDYTGYTLEEIKARCLSLNPVVCRGTWGEKRELIGGGQTPYFTCDQWRVKGSAPLENSGMIRIGLVTEGSGVLKTPLGTLPLQRGTEVFFPYDVPGMTLEGELTLVLCSPEKT